MHFCSYLLFVFPMILLSFMASYSCHHCNTVGHLCTSSQQQSNCWYLGKGDGRIHGGVRGCSPKDFSSLLCCSTELQPSCCFHTWSQFGHQRNAVCEPTSSLCYPSVKADEKERTWARSCCSRRTRTDASLAVMLENITKGKDFLLLPL